jgi:hypothetical protein
MENKKWGRYRDQGGTAGQALVKRKRRQEAAGRKLGSTESTASWVLLFGQGIIADDPSGLGVSGLMCAGQYLVSDGDTVKAIPTSI